MGQPDPQILRHTTHDQPWRVDGSCALHRCSLPVVMPFPVDAVAGDVAIDAVMHAGAELGERLAGGFAPAANAAADRGGRWEPDALPPRGGVAAQADLAAVAEGDKALGHALTS